MTLLARDWWARTFAWVVLLVFNGDRANYLPGRLLEIFIVGQVYNLVAVAYVILSLALLGAAIPSRSWGKKLHDALALHLSFARLVRLLFVAVFELILGPAQSVYTFHLRGESPECV